LGDKTCYPCSKVVKSAYGSQFNWTSCLVMPGTVKVFGETDIRKSAIVVSLFSDLIPKIPNKERFYNFISGLRYTFSGCNWFKGISDVSKYVRQTSFWDYKQKMEQLFNLGLLYPFEFSIYSIYNKIDIRNELLLRYFLASLAESTNKIFNNSEIADFFKKLSQSEIEDVLAIQYLRENIDINKINDDYFADILEIDVQKRYPILIDGVFYLDHIKNKVNSLYKISDLKYRYEKMVNRNFRALENKIRKDQGYDEVGSYYMEKLLYDKLKNEFPELSFYAQYSPPWLRPQRFDIYIANCNMAVEYHGEQHFRPIDFFGGEEGFKLRKKLDSVKREKCLQNGIRLVEISYEEDFHLAFENLKELVAEVIHTDNKRNNNEL